MNFNFGIISDHVIPGGNPEAVRVNDGSSLTFNGGLLANNEIETSGPGTVNGLATMDTESSVGYVSPGSPDFNYHLQAISPAIDGALGSLTVYDIDGELRDAFPDYGADEFISSLFSDGFESGNSAAWSSTVW